MIIETAAAYAGKNLRFCKACSVLMIQSKTRQTEANYRNIVFRLNRHAVTFLAQKLPYATR